MSHYLFFSSEGKASFDFTTELNQPLALDGQWEVGLTEIIGFPSSPVFIISYPICENVVSLILAYFPCCVDYLRQIHFWKKGITLFSTFPYLKIESIE